MPSTAINLLSDLLLSNFFYLLPTKKPVIDYDRTISRSINFGVVVTADAVISASSNETEREEWPEIVFPNSIAT